MLLYIRNGLRTKFILLLVKTIFSMFYIHRLKGRKSRCKEQTEQLFAKSSKFNQSKSDYCKTHGAGPSVCCRQRLLCWWLWPHCLFPYHTMRNGWKLFRVGQWNYGWWVTIIESRFQFWLSEGLPKKTMRSPYYMYSQAGWLLLRVTGENQVRDLHLQDAFWTRKSMIAAMCNRLLKLSFSSITKWSM